MTKSPGLEINQTQLILPENDYTYPHFLYLDFHIFLNLTKGVLVKNKQMVRKCPESDRFIDFVTTGLIDLHEAHTKNIQLKEWKLFWLKSDIGME